MTSIIPLLPPKPTVVNVTSPIIVGEPSLRHYTIAAGSTMFSTSSSMFGLFHGPNSSITNNGTIWFSGGASGPGGGLVSGFGLGNFTNNGMAVVEVLHGGATGIYSGSSSVPVGTIANNGSLFAITKAGNAHGINAVALGHTIQNNGLIAVQAFTDPEFPHDPWFGRLSGKAYGIQVYQGNASVTNGANGRILVEGDQAIGIWMRPSHVSTGIPYEISNAGLIRAVSTEAGTPSTGLFLATIAFDGYRMRVINSGTIEADRAIFAPSNGFEAEYSRIEYAAEEITNTATGILRGEIDLRNGDDILTNQGLIDGDVYMGPDNDLVDTIAGTLDGTVYLGLGDDIFRGSAGADVAVGERDNDQLEGNAGDDLLLGGIGDDLIVGGAGNDGLHGEYGDDRLVVAGGDVARGGHGDDRIELVDFRFRLADGGAGFDTLLLPGGARTLDLGAALATGRLAGIEEIVLGGLNELVVWAADVVAITGGGRELRITASATDKIDLVGTWTEGASRILDGLEYRSFDYSGSTVLVQQGATISVVDIEPVGATGLDPIAPGAAPPTPDGPLGQLEGFTLLFDPYELEGNTFRVGANETWFASEGEAVFFSEHYLSDTTRVVNEGTLLSSGTGRVTPGIDLYIGNVENSGTIWSENLGEGLSRAVLIGAHGVVTNTGDIIATAWNGDAIGIHSFSVDGGIPETPSVINRGYVGADSENGFGIGMLGRNIDTRFLNEGIVEAYGGDGSVGVHLGIAGGILINHGRITASAAPTSTYFAVGFSGYGWGSLVNTGLIEAEIAVDLIVRQGETFDVENLGTIRGMIHLGLWDPISVYGHVNVTNSGDIFGDIFFDPGTLTGQVIINTGLIEGDVMLAGGDDRFDGSGGVQNGIVSGGGGNDRLTGGIGADVLIGEGGNDILTGGGGDDLLDGGAGINTLSGGLGNDIYVVEDAASSISEAPGQGVDEVRTTSSNYVLGTDLERLTYVGAGSFTGTGNSVANVIRGGSGNDLLDGAGGADAMAGAAGDDIYLVDNVGDSVSEAPGAGSDLVKSSVNYTLGANVENLTLTGAGASAGTGNGLDNRMIGNAAANALNGAGGNDILDGGLGADAMTGGAGNDFYFVDNAGDTIVEAVAAGIDTVQTALDHSLGANVENLVLVGGAVNGIGNGLNNAITGNGANNLIDGRAGADAMAGGFGHDTYIVDNAGDTVTEALNAGNDTVQSSVSFTLSNEIEHLTLTGTGAINGTGNALNNVINGNGANNILNGGVGADFLTGGLGNDTYVVDNASDSLTEASGGGADTVQSAIGWTLAAEFERLVLTGTAAVNGNGNALDNQITGNAAANVLNGGLGADAMAGGLGNDTFVVDNSGDTVSDTGGVDTVQSSVSFVLGATIDNLTLTGTAAVNGTGNALWNVMIGNSAANTLDGGLGNDIIDGGAGADTLIGGQGHDTYHVDQAGDQVIDTGGGNDHVHAAFDYVLGSDLEYLTLTGSAVSGTGNAKNNLIYGNASNNVIDGGLGADFMVGGMGDDIYYVENGSDSITEHLNQGNDTVMSSVHHALRGNIENLTLIGTNAVSATGNTLNNVLIGNSAGNVIYGGIGADTMSGGGGNDSYTYRSAQESSSTSRDTISGFNAGDRINLSTIDAIAGTPANNDAFTFIGSTAFHGVAGELRATEVGGVWTIEADVNGDGLADLVIGLTTDGGHILGAGDFVL